MRNILSSSFFACILALPLLGQPVVAPSTEPVGSIKGENMSGYNITNSFELGYRFHEVDGNPLRYRSDVNFGNGIRLLGSSLTVNSRNGKGKLFDEIVLTTQGLGNDPYQYSNLRIQQNRWYRYDLLWRTNDYFNPGLTTGTLGGHLMDTRRIMQDHDLTLFPSSRIRVLAGYSRITQSGPALSSIQLFDARGDEYPLFASVDRVFREIRLGAEARFATFKFIGVHGWQRFEESTASSLAAASRGANTNDNNVLNSLRRTEPYQGDTPFWRFHLMQDKKAWYSVGARFSYAGSRRDFTFDELSSGADRLGINRNRQVLVSGSGRRPLSTGSITLSLFPGERWTISNHTAFHQIQMDGDNAYTEINNTVQSLRILRFDYLSLRTFVNSTDATWRAAKWLGFYSGYHYSTRRIQSRQAETIGSATDLVAGQQENHQHAGAFGIRLQPTQPLSINLDTEIGRNDQPFYPISDRNYHALSARARYKFRNFQFTAQAKSNYNVNSNSLFVFSARSRNYSADLSWSPQQWISFDAGYGKLHLDTVSGLAYFATGQFIETDRSLYFSNIHTGNLGIRLNLRKRADLYLGYSHVQDAGDGRASATSPSGQNSGSILAAIRGAQVFPLAYQTPYVRFSVVLHSRLRWNVGYQYYRYAEDFAALQNYRANTGFTSLLWSF